LEFVSGEVIEARLLQGTRHLNSQLTALAYGRVEYVSPAGIIKQTQYGTAMKGLT
jgi:hypothetical protein